MSEDPPRPPKRSLFRKPTWQIDTGDDNADPLAMFSRAADSYKGVLEAAERQRQEEKAERQRQQELKRLEDEEGAVKRRKMSEELQSPVAKTANHPSIDDSPSRNTRSQRATPTLSSTKYEPSTPSKSLSTQYNKLVSQQSPPAAATEIVTLDDSDEDENGTAPMTNGRGFRTSISPDKDQAQHAQHTEANDQSTQHDEHGNPSDTKAESGTESTHLATKLRVLQESLQPQVPDPKIEVLVQCHMPDFLQLVPTYTPTLIKIRYSMPFRKVREAWIDTFQVPQDLAKNLILTHNRVKLWNATSAKSLGITLEDAEDLGKLEFEVTTDELLKKAKEPSKSVEAPQVKKPTIGLILQSKGHEEFKLKVHTDTSIFKIINAYRKKLDLPGDTNMTIMLDGEALSPDQLVMHTEIEGPEQQLDVYIR